MCTLTEHAELCIELMKWWSQFSQTFVARVRQFLIFVGLFWWTQEARILGTTLKWKTGEPYLFIQRFPTQPHYFIQISLFYISPCLQPIIFSPRTKGHLINGNKQMKDKIHTFTPQAIIYNVHWCHPGLFLLFTFEVSYLKIVFCYHFQFWGLSKFCFWH